MNITRRDALRGAAAVAATGAVPIAAMASSNQTNPLLEGVQALVDEIRQGLNGSVIMASYWALQSAADRLEALPGVRALPNEHWPMTGATLKKYGHHRALRGLPS